MPETSSSPLIQALRNKAKGTGTPQDKPSDAERLLEFILTHFQMMPKEKESNIVTTQESHAP